MNGPILGADIDAGETLGQVVAAAAIGEQMREPPRDAFVFRLRLRARGFPAARECCR